MMKKEHNDSIEQLIGLFREHMLLQAAAILFVSAENRLGENATYKGAVDDAKALLREIEKKSRLL